MEIPSDRQLYCSIKFMRILFVFRDISQADIAETTAKAVISLVCHPISARNDTIGLDTLNFNMILPIHSFTLSFRRDLLHMEQFGLISEIYSIKYR
jgi:hypothetical protein